MAAFRQHGYEPYEEYEYGTPERSLSGWDLGTHRMVKSGWGANEGGCFMYMKSHVTNHFLKRLAVHQEVVGRLS